MDQTHTLAALLLCTIVMAKSTTWESRVSENGLSEEERRFTSASLFISSNMNLRNNYQINLTRKKLVELYPMNKRNKREKIKDNSVDVGFYWL